LFASHFSVKSIDLVEKAYQQIQDLDLTGRAAHVHPGPVTSALAYIPEPGVTAHELRRAISHMPTGVTVVSSRSRSWEPVATTASAVVSLSLDPALLLVCLDSRSTTLEAIRNFGAFAVNVLAEDHEGLSANFARPGRVASWRGVEHVAGLTGSPRLSGALAVLDCELAECHPGGDHEIVIGRVLAASADGEAGRRPLIHWRGEYAGLRRAS
jgi:flavin reductase (DIM6/NTAB) family NADH-FMN oxidoreductase RutF